MIELVKHIPKSGNIVGCNVSAMAIKLLFAESIYCAIQAKLKQEHFKLIPDIVKFVRGNNKGPIEVLGSLRVIEIFNADERKIGAYKLTLHPHLSETFTNLRVYKKICG